tara:strand:+ start:7440 stop:8678 length:1239 start_codon:yes stop_codon:yes gene_type:complete
MPPNTNTPSNYWQNQNAIQLANMTPEQRANYQSTQQKQGRTNAAITGGAGIADIIGGGIGQRQAEGDIDMLGAEGDSIREQMKNLKAPGAMDSETTAAAVRNATILGGVSNQQEDDSSELAAAKMAIDSGGDPANIQRALTEANSQKDAVEKQQQQGAFNQGLGYAQQDARAGYDQDMQGLGMDYDENQRALQMAQQESLMAQQQKQGGIQNAVSGGMNFLQNDGINTIKGMFGGGTPDPITGLAEGVNFNETPYNTSNLLTDLGSSSLLGNNPNNSLPSPSPQVPSSNSALQNILGYDPTSLGSTGGLDGDPNNSFAQGGVVQETPGVFNHDDGDGEFQEGENEMMLMAQQAGGLEDTGIRMTGGEFVINPKQAKGMEKAYDRIKRKKDPSRRDLMALYDAVRFLDESQFD